MDLNLKKSGVFRWQMSMSEYSWMQIQPTSGELYCIYGWAVAGGLSCKVIQSLMLD